MVAHGTEIKWRDSLPPVVAGVGHHYEVVFARLNVGLFRLGYIMRVIGITRHRTEIYRRNECRGRPVSCFITIEKERYGILYFILIVLPCLIAITVLAAIGVGACALCVGHSEAELYVSLTCTTACRVRRTFHIVAHAARRRQQRQ